MDLVKRILAKFNRILNESFASLRRSLATFVPRDPVYIFHHIPKCGGTSLRQVLDTWFITIKDYRPANTSCFPDKVNLESLRSNHCLCSHFELDGYYLHQRYPEALMSDRYKIFTFVRDPLQVKLSLFRFQKKHGLSNETCIEDHLFNCPNYIANRFPATTDNYKEVIDRYFFVGILEENKASLAILASLMGKRFIPLPRLNAAQVDRGGNHSGELSEETIARFKSENALDYLIYDYCVEKFNKIQAEFESV